MGAPSVPPGLDQPALRKCRCLSGQEAHLRRPAADARSWRGSARTVKMEISGVEQACIGEPFQIMHYQPLFMQRD
jgi:hypothetical protein